ncbi:hypothetical protein KP79_PYT01484 [Mizuhopecten yessoensis]|uniref:Uncharacterized protein n=1 Tax=Mizuhopecten yessoensis TaxID=6573 RepID=A0A210QBB4_MIZYE|nr:hypothetical protein KP79_PYT01484 [Mizuhopecten yessoensis]
MQLQQVQKGTIMKSPLGKSMRKFVAISFIAFVGTGALLYSVLDSHITETKKRRGEQAAVETFSTSQDLGRLEYIRNAADGMKDDK